MPLTFSNSALLAQPRKGGFCDVAKVSKWGDDGNCIEFLAAMDLFVQWLVMGFFECYGLIGEYG
jgi:hypothetical protein